jgi:hypothetical protein
MHQNPEPGCFRNSLFFSSFLAQGAVPVRIAAKALDNGLVLQLEIETDLVSTIMRAQVFQTRISKIA